MGGNLFEGYLATTYRFPFVNVFNRAEMGSVNMVFNATLYIAGQSLN